MGKHEISLLSFVIVLLAAAAIFGVAGYYVGIMNGNTPTGHTNYIASQTTTSRASVVSPTAVTSSPVSSPSPTTATMVTTCVSSNLTVSLTNGNGTAGTYYYDLALTNTGATPCTLAGYPTVSVLDKTGGVLGTAVHSGSSTTKSITLASGAAAYAAVGLPNSGNYYGTNTTCTAGASSLRVVPATGQSPLTIDNIGQRNPGFTDVYCPSFSVGQFSSTK